MPLRVSSPVVGKVAMWLCRIMVAVLLVGTEAHLCLPEYTRANGDPCTTCQELTDQPAHHAEVANTHGDCHDCCVIKPCDDHKPPQPAAATNLFDWQVAPAPAFTFSLRVLTPEEPPQTRDVAPPPPALLLLPDGCAHRPTLPRRAPPLVRNQTIENTRNHRIAPGRHMRRSTIFDAHRGVGPGAT